MAVGNVRNQAYIDAFGKHVKQLRNAKKLSRETVAAYAEIEVMQVYRIETGKINTTISTLLALSKALEVAPHELLNFKF
ncbi:Xre family transcriptional regulator [Chitinophaga polysaccharea]|uniref:Xre family transcriptional regulator n=1 Tax=Chitinophaga polysaccharea TaxID=1293035 RepID=A0A561P6F3_9BACT|nr:Xre family transcriptional regulator [Chitinophaga polysaccharea]